MVQEIGSANTFCVFASTSLPVWVDKTPALTQTALIPHDSSESINHTRTSQGRKSFTLLPLHVAPRKKVQEFPTHNIPW